MTKSEKFIKMARDAGLPTSAGEAGAQCLEGEIVEFAEMVAADERGRILALASQYAIVIPDEMEAAIRSGVSEP